MIKKIILPVLLLSHSFIFSQTVVNSINIDLKKDRDVFQIVDQQNKKVILFLSDKKNVNALKLDENFIVIDSISTLRPDKNYSEMCGYIQSNNQYKLFWSSGDSKSIQSQTFDFETKKTVNKIFNLELKKERIIQKFYESGKFYIVTTVKDSNFLKFYIFDESDTLSEKTIDFEKCNFYLSNFKKSNLYGLLSENLLPFENAFSLQRIVAESPSSLTFSSKKRKCYINKNNFIVSIDTNTSYSQLITINLLDFTYNEKIFKQPFILRAEFATISANSFLIEDKLFQIKLNEDVMYLIIKDLDDNLLKEYKTFAANNIEYKNSNIIQENGNSDNSRVLDKTFQFLRKINSSNCGISCYKLNENFLIKIGSVSELQQNNSNVMYGAMLGGIAGALIAAAISNPTYDNFSSYANRKVVYINSLFDINNNHVKGVINPIAFDKIQNYLGKNNPISPTIFQMDNNYYLGKFNEIAKTYVIMKFTD